jgi:hypothetical protein
VKRNTGKFNVTVWGTIDNSNIYSLYVGTSGNCTIHSMSYSRVTFDQTSLQSTQLTFIDSGVVTGYNTNWTQLSLSFPWMNSTNFMIGMTGFAYEAATAINFVYTQATLICAGSMTFNMLEFGYFNYRYRSCPAGYPYFL